LKECEKRIKNQEVIEVWLEILCYMVLIMFFVMCIAIIVAVYLICKRFLTVCGLSVKRLCHSIDKVFHNDDEQLK